MRLKASLIFILALAIILSSAIYANAVNNPASDIKAIDLIKSGQTRNIPFGAYKWRVLAVENDKALLISEDAILPAIYDDSDEQYGEGVTWETCTLRKFLNSIFFDSFGVAEQSRIIETEIVNNEAPYNDPFMNGGRNTKDKIFILSVAEARKYFKNDADRIATFNIRNNEYGINGQAARWDVRTPLSWGDMPHMGCVGASGKIYEDQCADLEYNAETGAVYGGEDISPSGQRPAFWLRLSGANLPGQLIKPDVSIISAYPISAKVLLNGKAVAFDAYEINDNNYFKLRDIAFALRGTEKQFEVGWDEAADAISLISGDAYTPSGGEMAKKGSGVKSAVLSDSKIILDGDDIKLTAYKIDGFNYFKLRDIGAAFDFAVEWDERANTISINTGKSYRY